ncbi:MAG: phage tail protein I, partial [Candidatus Pacearchaeota archaeon]|nr:phage tail protein I [Candidatus Pacearchaeota archaeon]
MNKLLPPNATELEKHLVETTERASAQNINAVSELWNADTCPVKFLPWLAWAEGVQEWSSQWSEPVQRAVIKTTRQTRRYRGTAKAVIDAVAGFGGTSVIKEWFEKSPQGTPGTFDVTIVGGDSTQTNASFSWRRSVPVMVVVVASCCFSCGDATKDALADAEQRIRDAGLP